MVSQEEEEPDMAQSGGQNVKGVQNAINQLKKYLINK